MPAMLGWFRFSAETSLEDVEWLMARSAGYDAGFGLTASPITFSNARGEEALETIKQWETARLSGAFNADQKKRMERISNEFRLIAKEEKEWILYQFALKRHEHKQIIRQPGEPVSSSFTFENPNKKQPVRFIITAPKETAISEMYLDIDNFKKIEFPLTLPAGYYLKYDGGTEAIIYSGRWEKVSTIPVDIQKLELSEGSHKLIFDCRFEKGKDSIVKLEMKTINDGEKVSSL